MIALAAAACEDATTWPEVVIGLGVLAFCAFTLWIFWVMTK